ncbi:hypothetical protein [Roseobacter litoralis]|uniref:VWFA domain-containing protein n=1 Tax=Roseobacter litoralis (strain ATCC 49566 / DSM 6996 / JCM 21268 / NBRC 15278 / OCh 149) TaxID=391595 RepID=F7ZJN2_ROSLO|nr:hypothetical protein [Roseobacter litoralis]AEI93863.1 hypothetical protein RLO149_c018750 [Roseobacter litoralis Och 149]
MKYFNVTACAVSALLAFTAPLQARDTVFVVSPDQPAAALKSQLEMSIQHVLETLKAGETAIFIDGQNARMLGIFLVPEGKAYENPNARITANRDVLSALKKVIDAAENGNDDGATGVANIPGALRLIASNFTAGEGGADLVVLADPRFSDALAPSVSMMGGAVPGDGHVLAKPSQSPFGTKGFENGLRGYDVYFGMLGANWAVSNAHRAYVERLLAASASAMGGKPQVISDDLNTLFARLKSDVDAQVSFDPLVATDKLEMITFAPDTGDVPDIFTRDATRSPAPRSYLREVKGLELALSWDCDGCDLDLYAWPSPASDVIYFQQSQTDEGQLFKDFTNSPNLTNGYETIQFSSAVDPSALQIAVNLYRGTPPGGTVTGELRLGVGDDVWITSFQINAPDGNKGYGGDIVVSQGRAPSEHWVMIDPIIALMASGAQN